jgi:hypothetical protein
MINEMNYFLRQLIGLEIAKMADIHDYSQVFFTDGSTLNIFNSYVLEGVDMKEVQGRIINNATEGADEVKLSLTPSGSILVDIRDIAYIGPEAMEYVSKDNQITVWN